MNEYTLRRAITALRMIFWGGLLCIFDITYSQTTNGRGFKFDILNDVLGTVLIAIGVFWLGAMPVHSRYKTIMKFVQVGAILAVLDAILDQFIMPLPPAVSMILSLIGLVTLVAIVSFCVAMRWFCEEAHLFEASRSWLVTTVLFVVIYLIPLGLLRVIIVLATASGKSFNINLGPEGLLLLPIRVIPRIHLFISTSRMKLAIEAAGDSGHLHKKKGMPDSW